MPKNDRGRAPTRPQPQPLRTTNSPRSVASSSVGRNQGPFYDAVLSILVDWRDSTWPTTRSRAARIAGRPRSRRPARRRHHHRTRTTRTTRRTGTGDDGPGEPDGEGDPPAPAATSARRTSDRSRATRAPTGTKPDDSRLTIGLYGPVARRMNTDPRTRTRVLGLLHGRFGDADLFVSDLRFGGDQARICQDPRDETIYVEVGEVTYGDPLKGLAALVVGGDPDRAEAVALSGLLRAAASRDIPSFALVGERLLPVEQLVGECATDSLVREDPISEIEDPATLVRQAVFGDG